MIRFKTIYKSPLVTIRDACCRPHAPDPGAEELSVSNDIVFPRTGLFVRHVGHHQSTADPTAMLFFRQDETYRISHPIAGGDDCTSLSFDPNVLVTAFASRDPSAADRPQDPFTDPRASCNADLFTGINSLRRLALNQRDGAEHLDLDEAAMEVLARVVRSASLRPHLIARRPATTQAHRDLAERARVYLAAHLAEPVALADIARGVFASPYHLARVFRRETGHTLHAHLTRLRLRRAMDHLCDDRPDLTALALSLGFSSHSHFSHAFRREFGMSPAAFRDQSLAGGN